MAPGKKDYRAIAAKKIRKPNNKDRSPQILVYARNKKGKSTFGASAPDVLILDPEDGTDYLPGGPDVWPIESWEDLEEVYKFLRLGDHPYKWVCVDGVTRISNMSLRFVMNLAEERDLERTPGMVAPRDYGKAGELFKGMLLNFQTLNMGVVYCVQERMIEVTDEAENDEDADEASVMFVPDLPKGARSALNSIVDVIGRIYTVPHTKTVRTKNGGTREKQVIQRRIWLQPHSSYDTGYRSEFELPPYLANPTVPKLVELINNGKVAK